MRSGNVRRLEALEAENDGLKRLLAQTREAACTAQIKGSTRLLDDVLAIAPDCAEADRLLSAVLHAQHQGGEAIVHLRQAVARRPNSAVINMHLGMALCERRALDDGVVLLKRACELAPGMAATWFYLGQALKMQLRSGPACEALRRTLSLDPANVHARISLAHMQVSMGDVVGAVTNYREVLRQCPDSSRAWFALANMKTERFSAEDVTQLRNALGVGNIKSLDRIHIGFALAKALEDQGDYAAAFRTWRMANQFKRHHAPWNAAAARGRIDAIMAEFAKPGPPPTEPTLGREVIFIATLPRSGSTLVEQILASHPQVEGANEITDLFAVIDGESHRRGKPFPTWVDVVSAEDWSRLGREYLARTKRWHMRRPRFTDKNLVTWQYVGAVMRMLPGCRIVNSRRDPLETCFSCYRQLFSGGNEFSYDLYDMVDWYEDYHRLTRRWVQLFPLQVMDFEYESLLADPEYQIRRLLNFCGLAFDPTCLDFHQTKRAVLSTASAAQVHQPLHIATHHSDHYRRQLAPVRARLRAAGLIRYGRSKPSPK